MPVLPALLLILCHASHLIFDDLVIRPQLLVELFSIGKVPLVLLQRG